MKWGLEKATLLKDEAGQQANFLGHELGVWRGTVGAFHAYCNNCGRKAWIDSHGSSGNALTERCDQSNPVQPHVGAKS